MAGRLGCCGRVGRIDHLDASAQGEAAGTGRAETTTWTSGWSGAIEDGPKGQRSEGVAVVQCQVDVPDWFHDSEAFCKEKCPKEPNPPEEGCDFHSESCGGGQIKYFGNCSCSAGPLLE